MVTSEQGKTLYSSFKYGKTTSTAFLDKDTLTHRVNGQQQIDDWVVGS